ncbi:MAG: hypothetical protein QOF29_3858 [bacterium]|jgi:phenylpropionate dioxygenase-like ring-hydroxylating dioxygenase large terminal subunit|nr:hypothetical protein [Solirubrobacteraceae bacterium]
MEVEASAADINELIPREQLEAVERPTLEAHTLPPKVYWSPEILELELEHVFFKEWLCVGRVEDIPNPGDFYTRTLATESLIVVRDADGEIRCHLNVCRHRGCEIISGSGTVKTFRCPYHGWMYSLDGELRATPDFKETLNFDKKDYGLHTARVEIWNNFIMVNLDPDATPFAGLVSEMDNWGFDKYDTSSFTTIATFDRTVACNWKVYVENGAEEYHIPWVHPTLQDFAPMKGWADYPDLTDEPWMLMVGLFPGLSWGKDGGTLFPSRPGVAELAPEFSGTPIVMVFPSLTLLLSDDTMVWRQTVPDGPERSTLWFGVCVPQETADALAAGDEDVRAKVDFYVSEVHRLSDEDQGIAEAQQRGVRSRRATQGRYCKHEPLAWLFDKRVAQKAYLRNHAGSADGHANGTGNGAVNGA